MSDFINWPKTSVAIDMAHVEGCLCRYVPLPDGEATKVIDVRCIAGYETPRTPPEVSDAIEVEFPAGDVRLHLTQRQYAIINPEGAETIGQLQDRLRPGEWTDLPEYGVRARLWTDEATP